MIEQTKETHTEGDKLYPYSPTPFRKLQGKGLTPIDKHVMAYYIMWYKTRSACIVRNSVIAKEYEISIKAVRRAKAKLQELELITVKKRYANSKRIADSVTCNMDGTPVSDVTKGGNPTDRDDHTIGGNTTDKNDRCSTDKKGITYKKTSEGKQKTRKEKSVVGCHPSGEREEASQNVPPSSAPPEVHVFGAKCVSDFRELGIRIVNPDRIPLLIADYLSDTNSEYSTLKLLQEVWNKAVTMLRNMQGDDSYFLTQKGLFTLEWYFQCSNSRDSDRRGQRNLDLLLQGVWGVPSAKPNSYAEGDRAKVIAPVVNFQGRFGCVKGHCGRQILFLADGSENAIALYPTEIEAA